MRRWQRMIGAVLVSVVLTTAVPAFAGTACSCSGEPGGWRQLSSGLWVPGGYRGGAGNQAGAQAPAPGQVTARPAVGVREATLVFLFAKAIETVVTETSKILVRRAEEGIEQVLSAEEAQEVFRRMNEELRNTIWTLHQRIQPE